MKRQIKKWIYRLTVTGLLIAGILLGIILNPIFTYAHKTTFANTTIFHNKDLDSTFICRLKQATELLQASEFYHTQVHFDICLNDGSVYPDFMQAIRGQAFAWGFYDKVVLQGTMNCKENYVELNGYKWNLIQLLAHEMTHCLQFDKLGFWKSNPVANIPEWKWEGYAEYLSRQSNDHKNLLTNLDRLITTDDNSWGIDWGDGTIAPKSYYEYWTLMQYCIDIKKMTYKQILDDKISEQTVKQEMIHWYEQNKSEYKTLN